MTDNLPELPPSVPKRVVAVEEVENIGDPNGFWDPEHILSLQLGLFEDDYYRAKLIESDQQFTPQLRMRTQLAYKLIIDNEGSSPRFHYPSKKYVELHNRAGHSLRVGSAGASLGQAIGLSEEDCFILALAGNHHDYAHPVFSHLGENCFRSMQEAARATNPILYGLLSLNLYTSHEGRLLNMVSDPANELGRFLNESLTLEQYDLYKETIQEKGRLGPILKVADTAVYLRQDSVWSGYENPQFLEYFKKILTLNKDGHVVTRGDLGDYPSQIIKRFQEYRLAIWQAQYRHPINCLYEQMQHRGLAPYIEEAFKQGGRRTEKELFTIDDSTVFADLRKEFAMGGDMAGLAFWGVPYTYYSPVDSIPVCDDLTGKDIIIDTSGGIPHKEMVLKSESGVHIRYPHPETEVLDMEGDIPFWRTARGIRFSPPEDLAAGFRPFWGVIGASNQGLVTDFMRMVYLVSSIEGSSIYTDEERMRTRQQLNNVVDELSKADMSFTFDASVFKKV